MLTDGRPEVATIDGMEEVSLVAFALAFTAGFVSFASPCVLALVPGYLSFVSGVSFDRMGASTRDVIRPTLAFVAGFAAMFTAFGVSVGLVGHSLRANQELLSWIGGGLMILMGISMLVLPRLGLFQGTHRLVKVRQPTTLVGASLVGAAFAIGWTPCIGPILGSIFTLALPSGSPWFGGTLLLTYSLGLGIPFLLSGLFLARTMSASRWIRDRWAVVNAVAALATVAVGVLIASGQLVVITQHLSGVGFQGI